MDTINKKLENLIEEIAEKRKAGHLYSMKEIDVIAEKVRNIVMGSNYKDPTPIVKIAEFFGLQYLNLKT